MTHNKMEIKVILTVSILSLFTSCVVPEREVIPSANSEKIIVANRSADIKSKQLLKEKSEELIEFKKDWETKILVGFKERSLEKIPAQIDESYRFVWLPSFDNPVAIRVWRIGDKQFLAAKKTNGTGFEVGKLLSEQTRSLTSEEWLKLMNLLEQTSFWNMPAIDIDEEPSEDGAYYVFEGNKESQFHEVHRGQSKEIKQLGACLLELSKLKTNYADY